MIIAILGIRPKYRDLLYLIQNLELFMPSSKNVIIFGGTGFLGYHVIRELLSIGCGVTALGLPPALPEDLFPSTVRFVLQNFDDILDADLLALLAGHDAHVFAAGMDDRITPKKPAYPFFHYANVDVCMRVLGLAKMAGIRRALVFGSYFAHFNRVWPELRLAERHPYIRSRVEQENSVLSIPGMDVNVLELPYIFGSIPVKGWKSLWTPIVNYVRLSPYVIYMKGGTACITAKTVGQAVVGALERGEASQCYPIGDENLTWSEMLTRLAAADGRHVQVINLPTWLVKVGFYVLWLVHQLLGKEAGLDPRYFAPLQMAETFIDPVPSQEALGYLTGGLDQAFQETVRSIV
jgi:dihydroflavonol-4-reductase